MLFLHWGLQFIPHTNTYTYIYIHTHARTHAYTHTHTHTHTYTHKRTHTHARTHTDTHTHAHTHTHIRHKHILTYTCYTQMCIFVCARACTCIFMRMSVHASMLMRVFVNKRVDDMYEFKYLLKCMSIEGLFELMLVYVCVCVCMCVCVCVCEPVFACVYVGSVCQWIILFLYFMYVCVFARVCVNTQGKKWVCVRAWVCVSGMRAYL